jgi:hypothetical protein
MTRQFKYTGVAPSLDNHESDYYESKNWTVCVWIGRLFNSKIQLQGEIENRNIGNNNFHFFLDEYGQIIVNRSLQSMYDGLGKRYRENIDDYFPIPNYVCDFIRTLKDKYVNTL